MRDDPTRDARTTRVLKKLDQMPGTNLDLKDAVRRKLLAKRSLPHNGTDTSVAAAESMTEDAKTLRAKVYVFVATATNADGHRRGATSDEAELVLGLSHQTCSARFNELRNAGLIVDSGERRPTRSGRNAAVYIVPELK